MIESNKAAFFRELEVFSGRYPSARWEPRHREAYWICLQWFDLPDVTAGLAAAAAASPQFLPPAEIVRNHVADRVRKRKAEEEERARHEAEVDEAKKYKNPAPREACAQLAYINGASTEGMTQEAAAFERLARQYECESLRLGLKPDQPTPKNIGQARLAQFWETFDLAYQGKVT